MGLKESMHRVGGTLDDLSEIIFEEVDPENVRVYAALEIVKRAYLKLREVVD